MEIVVDDLAGPQIARFLDEHDWDLAMATGQQLDGLDPALAEHALNWSRGMLRPEFRGAGQGGRGGGTGA